MLGTTDYVSPEQALGQPVTGQSDLYSLGIVLYEMLTGEVPFKGENQVAVAMKHVREELPDVQVKRPEVSAALAAVVDTATAKRLEDRYADDAEMIADLEDVLAIETARAGSATGEVTSVLRTLPSRPSAASRSGCATAPSACAGAAGGRARRGRGHRGSAPGPTTAPKLAEAPPAAHLTAVQPCQTCAHDYNPDALTGPKTQNPQEDGLAIDGNPNTAWATEHYYSGLQKAGRRAVRRHGQTVAGDRDLVYTQTPGWRGQIWGSNVPADPDVFNTGPAGWTELAEVPSMLRKQKIELNTAGKSYRYYLVWITALPPGSDYAAIDEIALYELTH